MFAMFFLLLCTIKGTWQLYDSKQMRVKGENALAMEKKKVKLTEEQEEDKGKWMGFQERSKVENQKKEVEKEVKAMQQGYFDVMAHLKNINVKIQSSVFYGFYFSAIQNQNFLSLQKYDHAPLQPLCQAGPPH